MFGRLPENPGISRGFFVISRRLQALALFFLYACMMHPVAAATLALEPVADTSIYRGDGFDNTSDGAGPHIWVSTTAGGVTRRALVRFDFSAIPSGAQINSAALQIYESRSRDVHPVALHRLLRSWGESTSNGGDAGVGAAAAPGDATWIRAFHPATSWVTPGGDFVPSASAQTEVGPQGAYYTWASTPTLVADVKAWVDNPGSNFGWIMVGDEQTLQNAKRFSSRHATVATVRPRLTIDYTPAPPGGDEGGDIPLPAWALGLLGAAIVTLLRRGERRNQQS